jgi:hypothetical protein
MTTVVIPSGYRRMRLLRRAQYAKEWWEAGAVVIVDDHTARGWLEAAHAEEATEPVTSTIATTCPKCGAAMEFPETPEPTQRWTQCKNPRCGHGWQR